MIEHIGTQTIETERLALRKFKSDDAEDLFKCMGDGEVTKYLWVEKSRQRRRSPRINLQLDSKV